jgi:hypothetical protein
MTELLEAALRHAARGWPVLPCDPRSKAPTISGGFRSASADPESIRRWFDRPHPPMLGIPTGAVTGLVVLDLDAPLGLESLLDLERDHGPLPTTATVETPSGGEHRYFQHPRGVVPCSAGAIAPGVDIRGDGGFVVVPPSARHDGRRYVAETEVPTAPMPAWLLDLIRRDGRRETNGAEVEAPRIPVGRRHDTLVRFAGSLRAMGLCEEAIVECGLALLRHQCETDPARPIDWRHAERTLRSVAKYPPRPNRGG